MKMNEQELVLKLYQNVDMGIVGIESIEDKIVSRSLLKVIMGQKEEYKTLRSELLKYCKKYDVQDKDLSPMAKVSSEIMSNMKLMMDKKDSHIAKMMMEGTNKGLIQLEELLNHYTGNDKELIALIEKVLKQEKENNDELKIFL